MSFIVYDVSFLVVFLIFLSIFLYKGRKRVKKEGLLLLYKTTWGIRLINYFGNKYKKTLKALSYVSITLGYILMATMLYLFGKIIWIYAFHQDVVRAIKVPPIMPLIPYLPQAFKLDFLPPFYFTYWIIILAIIAITHEFAHGIFAIREKVNIKTTGFGFFPFFLPIFLAAFVELDEKQMAKKSKFSQLAVLSAGTFANVLTALLFIGVLFLFFSFAFHPAGVAFDSYASSKIAIAGISSMNGIVLNNASYERVLNLVNETGFSKIEADGKGYLINKKILEQQNGNQEQIVVYDSAPAINIELESVIFKINGVNIISIDMLAEELSKYSPNDSITLNVLGEDGGDYNRDLVLGTHPDYKTRAWLGVGFIDQQRSGVFGKIISWFTSFKKPHVYYEPKFDGISVFIYNLLWWIILISISVALINMLPMGIFDGGRFFYLTIFALTKSEKTAKKTFSLITQLLLFLVLLMMIFWAFSVF